MGVQKINFRSNHRIESISLIVILTTLIPIEGAILFKNSESNLQPQSITSTIAIPNESKISAKQLSLTEPEINSILHLFNEIDNDFKSIEKGYSSNQTHIRILRSLSIRPKCTISKKKLTNLKNEIENVLSFASTTVNQNACAPNLIDIDNCNEVMKVIQCGIQQLKNGFVNAITLNENSFQEIVKWKNAYESVLEKYERESDNLKQTLSDDYQLKLDKLHSDLQKLGVYLNTALERLQTTIIELCVSKIMLGKTQEAVEYSKELEPISISKVIKQCYNFKNGNDELKNFENIISFITEQPKVNNDKIAYETLYKEMEYKHDINSLKVVLLAYGIRKSPAKNQLQGIYSKIEFDYSHKVKDILSNILLYNGKDVKLKHFAENYHNYFTDHLSENEKSGLKGWIW